MGDLEAEEKAREKAEVKREQKKAAKGEIKEEKPETKIKKKEIKKAGRGKRYLEVRSLVDTKKKYSIAQAVELVKKTSISKFDGAVEVHINVADNLPAGRQGALRGSVALPHGAGKQVRVRVADDELIANPKIDFDILVASPEMMPKLAKIAKILGPRGLMPNPKNGTIGDDPEKLALRLRSGQQSWKTETAAPIIHTIIGKVSFEPKKLEENFSALTKSVGTDKIKSLFIKATMGPSIQLEL